METAESFEPGRGTRFADEDGMTSTTSVSPATSRAPGLADRASHAFAPQACILGYTLLRKERLAVEDLTDAHARIAVKGAKARRVEVRVTPEGLSATCSCAPSSVPLLPCRHVWASLLELDRCEAFPALRQGRGKLALAMAEAGAAARADEVAAEPKARPRTPRKPPAKTKPKGAPRARAR